MKIAIASPIEFIDQFRYHTCLSIYPIQLRVLRVCRLHKQKSLILLKYYCNNKSSKRKNKT